MHVTTSLFLALDILWLPRKRGHVEKTISLGPGTDLTIKVFPMYDGQILYNVRYELVGTDESDQPGIRLTQLELQEFMLLRSLDYTEGWTVVYE